MDNSFINSIKDFNKLYGLPINDKPSLLGVERLKNFKNILTEEVNEIDEIIAQYESGDLTEENKLEILTNLSDWLGDMVVYIASESTKHGIQLDSTLKIIMDSNFSKLGADGKPIHDERGKVMKGPNYWKPEPKIKEHLKNQINNS